MLIFESKTNKKNNLNLIKYILINLKKKKNFLRLSILGLFVLVISLIPHNLGLGRTEERFYKRGISYITNIVFPNSNKPNIVDEMISYRGNFLGIFYRNLRSTFAKPKILEINLSFRNLNRLQQIRNEALKNEILLRSPNDEVNAKLKFSGESYPIKIRLKGDWTDHLLGDKWSFRVKTRREGGPGLPSLQDRFTCSQAYILL